MPNSWTEPRTAPPTFLPAIAGGLVILLALPLFLLAGWPVKGWAIGAVLWFGSEAFGAILTRLRTRTGNLAAAGVAAFGMLFRAIAVMVVVFAVAVSDKWVGLAAALTYAAGYSAALGLQLVAYYSNPKGGCCGVKRALVTLGTIALLLPANAFARGTFDPTKEFEQHEWVPIHLGPLNLSITKAVVYLILASLLTMLFGWVFMRGKVGQKAGRKETFGEIVYEIAQTQVAEQGLPTKAIALWFPYVATLMLFIFVVNLIGFIPLPLTGETWHGVPTWGIYAATSSISVTLALALLTFVFTHFEGIRWNGPVRYFKSWIPEAPKALLFLIVPLEILGQFMRLISLSVRLFANMLAGHILILTFIGLIFILQSLALIPVVIFAAGFYIFEVVIVVGIQAFIFAALSAIYIGSAIEPEH